MLLRLKCLHDEWAVCDFDPPASVGKTSTTEEVADHHVEPQNKMATKWGHQSGHPVNISVSSVPVREEKKTARPSSLQQLNEISLALQGQQTVQDIVNRATNLFRLMEEAKIVVDEKSKIEARNNNKKIQETLSGLKELFSRLRAIYDESNRRVDIPQGENLEPLIPLNAAEQESGKETPKDSSTALQIEHDTLQEKLRSKNKEIKDLIDKLRTLMWDINIMMAVKPS